MGAVYYAINPRLKKGLAIKVLKFELAEQQPETIERFLREAQAAAHIRSPHLVDVFDVNEDGGVHYLVMEFVRGMSAGAYLKQVKAAGNAALDEAIAHGARWRRSSNLRFAVKASGLAGITTPRLRALWTAASITGCAPPRPKRAGYERKGKSKETLGSGRHTELSAPFPEARRQWMDCAYGLYPSFS